MSQKPITQSRSEPCHACAFWSSKGRCLNPQAPRAWQEVGANYTCERFASRESHRVELQRRAA